MSREKQNNSADRHQRLSERQELLISRFCDGECSYVGSYLARRLLASNQAAQSFLAELQNLKHACSHLTLTQPKASTDLWDRIETRIEQEQYAARFLGERRAEEPTASVREWLNMRHVCMGGLSGAAIAVALITMTSRPSQLLTFSAPAAGPVVGPQLVQPAGISAPATARTHNSFPATRPHNPLEVDWMRANGSLKLIPDPSGSSAIIWVRRPSNRPGLKSSNVQRIPTPLGLSAPDLAFTGSRQRQLDETLQPSAK